MCEFGGVGEEVDVNRLGTIEHRSSKCEKQQWRDAETVQVIHHFETSRLVIMSDDFLCRTH